MGTTAVPPDAAEWTSKHGRAPGCDGLAGQLALVAGGTPLGILTIDGEEVGITPGRGASTTLAAEDERTMLQLLGGELHPVVARLQARASIDGDNRFGLRVLLGLQGGSPWTGLAPRS